MEKGEFILYHATSLPNYTVEKQQNNAMEVESQFILKRTSRFNEI